MGLAAPAPALGPSWRTLCPGKHWCAARDSGRHRRGGRAWEGGSWWKLCPKYPPDSELPQRGSRGVDVTGDPLHGGQLPAGTGAAGCGRGVGLQAK